MSEPVSNSNDYNANLQRARQFLNWFIRIIALILLSRIISTFIYSNPVFWFANVHLSLFLGLLFWARRQLDNGRLETAILASCAGQWVMSTIISFTIPDFLLVGVILALLPPVLA